MSEKLAAGQVHISEFMIGDIVYIKMDNNQEPRMIVTIEFYPTGVMYGCKNTSLTYHYSMELTYDKKY